VRGGFQFAMFDAGDGVRRDPLDPRNFFAPFGAAKG
jgi:hypothetical protein